MLRKLLRNLLGVDTVEKKVSYLSSQTSNLEDSVIKAEETRALIAKSVAQAELDHDTKQYLQKLNIQITNNSAHAALIAMNAAQAAERYGLKRFVPPVEETYAAPVISLEELQQHPEKYFHKLSRGIMGFPVGLNFDGINQILYGEFDTCQIIMRSSESNNGVFSFILHSILGYKENAAEIQEVLSKAMKMSDLLRTEPTEAWVSIDSLDFLSNYNGLRRFFLERPDLSSKGKKRIISAMQLAKFIYLSALEIVGKTRIKDPSELLTYQEERTYSKENSLSTDLNTAEVLKQKIQDSLLSQPEGTSYEDIQKLLTIRSKERFRQLASERTAEILSKDKERRGLTSTIGKDLKDYSVGECIVLACYFARNIIKSYRTLEDPVRTFLSDKNQDGISGKCTDYTGLALHYLREYLVPLHDEKFKDWFFGVEFTRIGDYNHCYIKAVHINPNKTVDVYFLDPTALANKGIKALKTPEKIAEIMDASKIPLLIERDAEDLLYKK